MNNIVLGTYEIENILPRELNLIVSEAFGRGCHYVDTSVCYNNDYLVGRVFSDFNIISKFPPQMTSYYEEFMSSHLENLGVEEVDIMLIHNPRTDWLYLANLMETDLRIKEVGVSNFKIEDLKEYNQAMGHYPKYNEIEINPNYYDAELIKFCKDNNIKIIAYAIFGGKYNAMKNIATYTLPVLLSLAKSVADLVILRVDSLTQFSQFLQSNDTMVENPSQFVSDKLNKSIEPMSYDIPLFGEVYVDGKPLPTYSKYSHDKVLNLDNCKFGLIPMAANVENEMASHICREMDKIFKEELPNFEFITDYRSFLRYKLEQFLSKFEVEGIVETSYKDDFLYVFHNGKVIAVMNVYLVKDGELTKINTEGTEFKYVILGRFSGVQDL